MLAVSKAVGADQDNKTTAFPRILVATDFSEHSKRVIEYAFDLKPIFGAAVYMLYVIENAKAIEFGLRQGHFSDTIGKSKWATNQLVNLTPDEFINDPTLVRMVEQGSPSDRIAGSRPGDRRWSDDSRYP